jgi:hypothetical protein
MNKVHATLLAVGTTMCLAAGAATAATIQIDVNGLRVATNGGGMFSTTHTGALNMTNDANATFNGFKINGVDQGVSAAWVLSNFVGTMNLSNGVVTGGTFEVSVTNASVVNTYSASFVNGAGSVNTQAGQGFTIDDLTFNGMFSGSTFAGVDINAWTGANLNGSMLLFGFRPGANGVDNDTDIDIYVDSATVIPLPAGAGLSLAGLAAIGCLRRRRV